MDIELNLTREQARRMKVLSRELALPSEYVVRRAMALYDFILQERKNGYQFGLEKDGLFYRLNPDSLGS